MAATASIRIVGVGGPDYILTVRDQSTLRRINRLRGFAM
jgi:hypothetical protein